MDSVDLEVLKSSARWLEEGHRALLVTVVKTWGSSPRPEGAMLAVRDDGLVVGSVSGGCIEDDLIDRVRQRGIEQTRPEAVKYGITAEEAHRFGLPCGGTIQLALEPLTLQSGIAELCRAVEDGRLVARQVEMSTGAVRLDAALATDGVHFDGERLLTIHGPRYRMLVIGAGQLSRYLCQIAVGLDYQVTVCDPREEYTEEWHIPGTKIVRTMPDDTVIDMKLDERCAVIALTHDPKLDDLALMEALKTPAFYVGALGSRRNNQARRERLKEFDLNETELARLHGPVGIYIGSRTPPEIAVSILAEVTAAKNGVSLPTLLQVEGAKAAREVAASGGAACSV
ncbi:predicted sulfurylase large subunit, molybdopterin cytosine dinucleotide biosynthesis /predicted sulfurylase small subunit, molybdopterin cytosine dinucleotide biosynthesis [Paraburkholderia fungorum]|uniref:Predicted sulfurylase large subunit, molybdopterin cytosine dinucleotide biosynthesis /predicted sulfurylase small subunit, molybdopterin cytosine dinucleotide biosynthesis n=1 Tax=Paraburkholderia fungorum TaxID=134537 RepID=A0A1H0Z2H7_9BURK|nr:XdhC family protein [Paraburkholderia fungorum]SDQ21598.1 predicted sulfurylase large subunit, molybdopterin cytosine dinucleotide biosynthesis /predicted sulfurylase small subunit, molybdopterin cytosine dinucleotide biosynthesis [Paraburkholderia fungorum]